MTGLILTVLQLFVNLNVPGLNFVGYEDYGIE